MSYSKIKINQDIYMDIQIIILELKQFGNQI